MSAPSSSQGDQPMPAPEQIRFYGVIPKTWCEHLQENINPVPAGGLDANGPCSACGDQRENWICLKCYQIFCSRFVNEDMKRHNEGHGHQLVLSLADLSVWCFGCDSYISNPLAQPAKDAAYLSKFGERGPNGSQESQNESDEDVER